ncbi:MAG: PQQ-dependent dehydrogenase, methanol/ethanol family [Proteobacteria bacterium]|nr:PQQ-dependent dehydrogenase, methanol/ethanol family [Pseudomonadota bacterium]
MKKYYLVSALLSSTLLLACGGSDNNPGVDAGGDNGNQVSAELAVAGTAAVDAARIIHADTEPGNWLSHGRTYDEQRYSPLDHITEKNVAQLGLSWSFDFPTNRGMEATPLVIDGVMYVSTSWSMVFAFDALSGKELWSYNPEVPKSKLIQLCCDAVNRGVAAWNGKIYVGTLDGRLVALDAKDGSIKWSVQTTPEAEAYSITGAPRIINGKVIIGNGGAELDVRGFVSAYDAETGKLDWRFYTVPGDPSKPFENPVLEKAAATWTGEWWKMGGGGTVWDSMAYDPELGLLYIGVGNGAPWNRQIRSPGGGDNLFLSSIVALKVDTGEYVWHYQTTPGETWDYTATQHMILADIEIDGAVRKVLMQAPKNGFFYVLDRATGELISAKKYAMATWASHVDMETGRPVEAPGARYDAGEPAIVYPSSQGGHNWHPMSYSPDTGLVYIPAHKSLAVYANNPDYSYIKNFFNTGIDWSKATLPDDPAERAGVFSQFTGFITAWDPVAQKEVWNVPHTTLWNGGMLSTAGNLLFQGNADGEFVAYRATSGEDLWRFDAQTGIVAAPITYTVGDKQYVAVVAGWGGAMVAFGELASRAKGSVNRSRLLVFELGADGSLPEPVPFDRGIPEPPELTAGVETIQRGDDIYHKRCFICHGEGAIAAISSLPDLRYMDAKAHQLFKPIVMGGLYSSNGMVSFSGILSNEDADDIHAYLISRGHELLKKMENQKVSNE